MNLQIVALQWKASFYLFSYFAYELNADPQNLLQVFAIRNTKSTADTKTAYVLYLPLLCSEG